MDVHGGSTNLKGLGVVLEGRGPTLPWAAAHPRFKPGVSSSSLLASGSDFLGDFFCFF